MKAAKIINRKVAIHTCSEIRPRVTSALMRRRSTSSEHSAHYSRRRRPAREGSRRSAVPAVNAKNAPHSRVTARCNVVEGVPRQNEFKTHTLDAI